MSAKTQTISEKFPWLKKLAKQRKRDRQAADREARILAREAKAIAKAERIELKEVVKFARQSLQRHGVKSFSKDQYELAYPKLRNDATIPVVKIGDYVGSCYILPDGKMFIQWEDVGKPVYLSVVGKLASTLAFSHDDTTPKAQYRVSKIVLLARPLKQRQRKP